MSKALRSLRIDVLPVEKPAKAQVVARVQILNPLTIRALDTARAVGARLEIEYDGARLVVKAAL